MIFCDAATTVPSGTPSTGAVMSIRRCLSCRLICDGPTPVCTLATAERGTVAAEVEEGVDVLLLVVTVLPPDGAVPLCVTPTAAPDETPLCAVGGISCSPSIESSVRRCEGGSSTRIGYWTPF